MSDYESRERRRNLIIGLFVIIAVCALVWLVFKFGDLPLKVSELRSYQVTIQFPTSQGVQKNTAVYFCGYLVGSVTDVRAPQILKDLKTGQFYHQTLVVIGIEKKYNNIPDDVEARLMTRGFGSSYIDLRAKTPDVSQPQNKFLKSGSPLQGTTGITSDFFPEESQIRLEQLIDGLGKLVGNANDIIGTPEGKENLKNIVANLSRATGKATEALEQFRLLSAVGTATLQNADSQMQGVFAGIAGAGEELSKATAQLRIILEKINTGQGSAGKFVNDGRLYEKLLENTEQLKVLLEQVKEKGFRIKLN
ncbi:MAG TPA: MlaD family protein [Sedimentisphaerales bacterium]|nr:MlaD family protein [Sedimentisphaerales bacterium]